MISNVSNEIHFFLFINMKGYKLFVHLLIIANVITVIIIIITTGITIIIYGVVK